MPRDTALACLVLAFIMFLFGFAIGTSQFLGQLIAWSVGTTALLVAAIAGAYAVLVDHFPPKD